MRKAYRALKGIERHYLCCLHIYCRLVDLGFSRANARKWAQVLTYQF